MDWSGLRISGLHLFVVRSCHRDAPVMLAGTLDHFHAFLPKLLLHSFQSWSSILGSITGALVYGIRFNLSRFRFWVYVFEY